MRYVQQLRLKLTMSPGVAADRRNKGYLAQENPLLGTEGAHVPEPEPPIKLAQLMSFRVWADPQQGQGAFSSLP